MQPCEGQGKEEVAKFKQVVRKIMCENSSNDARALVSLRDISPGRELKIAIRKTDGANF